jgi:hypothetical protein
LPLLNTIPASERRRRTVAGHIRVPLWRDVEQDSLATLQADPEILVDGDKYNFAL